MEEAGAWRKLRLDWRPTPRSLAETLSGGQAFRWRCLEGKWTGQWAQQIIELNQEEDRSLQWRSLTDHPQDEHALLHYLSSDVNFAQLRETLPWRSDPVLATALARWEGLRLLRQPFGETLLAFLCSSTKRIPQIAIILDTLAARLGQTLSHGYHALPNWDELYQAGETALRACGLGYRARHVAATAAVLWEKPGWLEETESLPYSKAKIRLLELPGVGEKIADCVLLFGAGHLEAFPVDTWMLKAMTRLYGLSGWKPDQVAAFGRIHFGAYAGYAQQVLFAGERSA